MNRSSVVTDEIEVHVHGPRRIAPAIDPTSLEAAAAFFRAAGDVSRLRLLACLQQGEWCVSELADATGEGLSTVSQRLKVLRSERLVNRRREGKHILYSLADEHVVGLLTFALEHARERR